MAVFGEAGVVAVAATVLRRRLAADVAYCARRKQIARLVGRAARRNLVLRLLAVSQQQAAGIQAS